MLALVVGGSGSGKSEYAEALALDFGDKISYIATMIPFGKRGEERIIRHKRLREGKNFNVIEKYRDVGKLWGEGTVILECVTNLVANEIFGENPKSKEEILDSILELNYKNVILVSGNVFEDGIDYDRETMKYIEILGYVNNQLAKRADRVIEVVCGIALEVKNESN